MSELPEAGQHPDADQLTAFVEHALPAHERQQTLAHLALCQHCRQIVALSLPPGDEALALEPAPVRRRWLPWAAIPALAALVLVTLFVRHQERTVPHTSVLPQMADAHKPAPPPVASAPPEALRSMTPVAPRAPQEPPVPAGNPSSTRVAARPMPLGGVMGGILGGIGAAPAEAPAHRQLVAPGSVVPPPAASSGQPAMARAIAASVPATRGPLPSHLPVLSMASRANQRVAIDTDNHLFFSNDEGRTWKAVPSPWKGRAVRVALPPSISLALKMSSQHAALVSGTITDPAGGVIAGASVTAADSSGVLVRSVTTDSQGRYRLDDLPPGLYRIEAQASGFENRSSPVQVTPLQQALVDITLRVVSAAQAVVIQGSPAFPTQGVTPAVAQTLPPFEVTTDDGERWTSADGQSWVPK